MIKAKETVTRYGRGSVTPTVTQPTVTPDPIWSSGIMGPNGADEPPGGLADIVRKMKGRTNAERQKAYRDRKRGQ